MTKIDQDWKTCYKRQSHPSALYADTSLMSANDCNIEIDRQMAAADKTMAYEQD